MCKKLLRFKQMNAGAVVDQATAWSDEMLRRECRCPGDLENAMRRLETRYGIPFSAFSSLRYRPPKDVPGSILVRLYAAYEAERQRQRDLLEADLGRTEKVAGPDHPLVRAVSALVGSKDETEGR